MVSSKGFVSENVGQNVGGNKVRSDFSDVGADFELPPGNLKRGEKMYKKHCAQCHSIYPDNRITRAGNVQLGPTMFNIYGRASGEQEIQAKVLMGSRANGMVWTAGPLMNYMKNPRQLIQGNVQMNFRGIDDWQTRVDIIHYLKTLDWENEEIAYPPERPPSIIPIFPFNVIGHYMAEARK